MTDLSDLSSKLWSLPTVTFGFARTVYPLIDGSAKDALSAAGTISWLNLWTDVNGNYGAHDIQTLIDSLNKLRYKIFDTAAYPDDQNYDDWPTLRDLWLKIAVQSNAIEEGGKTTLANLDQVPSDIADAAMDVPQTIGAAIGTVGKAAGSTAGSLLGGVFSGLGWPAILVGGVLLWFLLTRRA